MDIYNADLHIHSPHSIAVSKSLNLDTMCETCIKKGLHILGTGDILQPDWLKYMEKNLKKDGNGAFHYKNIYFILQTEIEDSESVHQVILFPDFTAVREIQKKLSKYSKNILGEWGGRPHINLTPAEVVETVIDSGCLIGPAHAFTPFKAIFRQGKFKTLKDCYQDAVKNIHFLELGLSADTELADRLDCLKNITFLSNSDAHSQNPRALGREFNKFEIDNASFEEILLGIKRKDDRKLILNVGLHPKLGKYYNMFCHKCRRRIIFKRGKKKGDTIFNYYSITDNFIVFYSNNPLISRKEYINHVSKNKMICPACKDEFKKNFKIKLGVSERIEIISSFDKPIHPKHRPPYIDSVPLIDIIRSIRGIKSTTSKSVLNDYSNIIKNLGVEFEILINTPLKKIEEFNENIASVIGAIRNNEIKYTPGGGGTFGQINLNI